MDNIKTETVNKTESDKNDNGFSKLLDKHYAKDEKHDRRNRWDRRHDRKRYHGRRDDRRKDKDTRIDYSSYDRRNRQQTLNLEILETARIEQHGLFPLAGKPLAKKSIAIDPFPEVPAIANSATANIANNFATLDLNLYNEQADTMDYIEAQFNVSTYAQLPTPEWNSNNEGTQWVFNGWDSSYNTYTTQRAVQMAQQLTLITSSMQTNTAFSGLLALTYRLKPNANDSNPFWKQYSQLGILGLIDGVNTMMLEAVTLFRQVKRDLVLLDYFTKRHPQFSSALQIAKGMFKIKRFTAVLDTIKFDLSYFFCDVEWVENKSKLLNSLTRYDDSIYSPVILFAHSMAQPAYQIGLDNGDGPSFSMNLHNGSLDSNSNPYFQTHMTNYSPTSLQGVEVLIRNLQSAVYNEGQPQEGDFATIAQQTVNDWYENYYNSLLTLSHQIQKFKTQIAAYTSFMIQATAANLLSYRRTTWEWDIDLEIKYIPEIAIPIKHPECTITSSPSAAGQFTASIILEGDHIEKPLVDSTRWYSLAMESFFLASPNQSQQQMRNYVLTLQFDGYNADSFNGEYDEIENAAMAGNNTLTGVFQLPEVAIYSWLTVYFANGTYARFFAYNNVGHSLYSICSESDGNTTVTNEVSIRGMWLLSDGTYYVDQEADWGTTYGYYLNYGISQVANAEQFSGWWVTGFKNIVDILGIMSVNSNPAVDLTSTPNNVGTYVISQDYTVGILVSMRTVYSEMRAETIRRLRMVEPLSPDSVQKTAVIPLH